MPPGRWRLRLDAETLEVETIWSADGAAALRFVDLSEAQRHRLIARLYLARRHASVPVRLLPLMQRALKRLVYPPPASAA